jgi:hypothetical protein
LLDAAHNNIKDFPGANGEKVPYSPPAREVLEAHRQR